MALRLFNTLSRKTESFKPIRSHAESTRAQTYQKKYPDRYIEVGVAEQNMASLAAGMALAGR